MNPDKFDRSQIKFYILVIPLVILTGLPIVFIFFHAFKPMEELFAFPPKFITLHPTLDNFRNLFKASRSAGIPLSKYVFNSVDNSSGYFLFLVFLYGSGLCNVKTQVQGKRHYVSNQPVGTYVCACSGNDSQIFDRRCF